MSKVLIDRGLLENVCDVVDSLECASGFALGSCEELRKLIAQPAEAEGVDFGFDDRSVKVSQEAYSIFMERERHHLAALSAVTAERDRLDAELATVKKVASGNLDLLDENAELRAEVKELRVLLSKSLPIVEAHAGASHMLEGFRPKRNKWDELVDEIRAVMAAKDADKTKKEG